MKSGTVVVRGSLTGAGIPLHAGQRLVASLTNKTLVVSEVARAERLERRAGDGPGRVAPRRGRAAPARATGRPGRGSAAPTSRSACPSRRPSPRRRWRAGGRSARRRSSPRRPAPHQAPRRARAPRPSTASDLGIGGASCNARPLPQIRFEHAAEGFRVLSGDNSSVFSNPVIDHSYSWCGGGSLRFDSSFDLAEPSFQSGEAVVYPAARRPICAARRSPSASWCAARSRPNSRRASWPARGTGARATATTRT